MGALVRYVYGCDDGGKRNKVVDDEDYDVNSSGCTLQISHFDSVAFDGCLLFEEVWVLRHILTLVLRSQSDFIFSISQHTHSHRKKNRDNFRITSCREF